MILTGFTRSKRCALEGRVVHVRWSSECVTDRREGGVVFAVSFRGRGNRPKAASRERTFLEVRGRLRFPIIVDVGHPHFETRLPSPADLAGLCAQVGHSFAVVAAASHVLPEALR